MNTLRRLYRGETNIDFIGHRKRWYIASAIIILVCLASLVFRGFNFGIEFAGGSQFQVPAKPGVSLQDVRTAVENQGVTVVSAQTAGSGSTEKYVVRTPQLKDEAKRTAAIDAVAKADHISADQVNINEVSSSWGRSVTDKALWALVVFLLVVGAYIWIRFEQKMAIAALAALAHDLLLTAGIYSLVGFEVTPGTVVGLLTILGFSLYDSVVVFDKVDENARGLLGGSRYTYAEVANQAVNQTLMRSINTSLIGLLPVAGLLFVGAGLLGVGTLKDLALVLFVGMLTGAYSSLFLATPWLVDLKMLDKRYKLHAQRVLARRAAGKSAEGGAEAKAGRAGSAAGGESGADEPARIDAVAASSAPRVGAKPAVAKAGGAKPAGGGKQGQPRKRSGGGKRR